MTFAPRAAMLFAALLCACEAPPPPAPPAPEPVTPPEPPPPPDTETRLPLGRGGTLGGLLQEAGLEPARVHAFIEAVRGEIDPRSLRPGHEVVLWKDGTTGALERAAVELSFVDAVDLVSEGEGFTAKKREVALETSTQAVSVRIESSLWDAFVSIGEDPALAIAASDVLAWEIDFYRDVRPGDQLDLLVQRETYQGRRVRDGRLLAVRYRGGIGAAEFFRFEHDGREGWYGRDGRSARRALLKQPLPLVRITSRYGGRKHPVLGYYKKHEGIDYGAPTGTPVWSVGDGVVEWAGWKGANGRLVSVRHANGWTSHYAHLSAIADGVKKGVRVGQKQVIGKVGASGRATGPHLHFALSRGGKMVNPLEQRFPAGTPLPAEHRAAFESTIVDGLALLDRGAAVASAETTPPSVD